MRFHDRDGQVLGSVGGSDIRDVLSRSKSTRGDRRFALISDGRELAYLKAHGAGEGDIWWEFQTASPTEKNAR